ncbi:hypothetical protein JXB27_00375 [Candidatus Woesearchaeota archaeon]|nr:hypothetical protein [Candidatus Woesearchaeota archaeon]
MSVDEKITNEERLNFAITELHVVFAQPALREKYHNLRNGLTEADKMHLLPQIFTRIQNEYFKKISNYEPSKQPTQV